MAPPVQKKQGKSKHRVQSNLVSLAQNRKEQPKKPTTKPKAEARKQYKSSLFEGEVSSEEEDAPPVNLPVRVSPRKRKDNPSKKCVPISESDSDSDLEDGRDKRKRQRVRNRPSKAPTASPTRTSPRNNAKRNREEPKRVNKAKGKAKPKLEDTVLPARKSSRIRARREKHLVANYTQSSEDSDDAKELDEDLDSGSDDFETPFAAQKSSKSSKSRSQKSKGGSRRSERIQKISKSPIKEKRALTGGKSKRGNSSKKIAESDSDSTDDVHEAQDDVCGTQESNVSEPLSLSIKAIPTRKRRRPSEGKLAEYQYMRKRLSEEERSILRVAFIKWYPTPPSNLQAQSRYEQQYGREMTKKMIEGLWKFELGPWSNRWWKFFEEFFDLARVKKMGKRVDRDPTITKAEAVVWSKEFYDKHGEARLPVEQAKSNEVGEAGPSNRGKTRSAGASNSNKTRSAGASSSGKSQSVGVSGSSKTRSGGASSSIKTRSSGPSSGIKTRSAAASKSAEVESADKLTSEPAALDLPEISESHAEGEERSQAPRSDLPNEKEPLPSSASRAVVKPDSRQAGKSSEVQKPIVKGKRGSRKGGLKKERLVAIPISQLNNLTSNLRSGTTPADIPIPRRAPTKKASEARTDFASVPLKIALRSGPKPAVNGTGTGLKERPLRIVSEPASSATSIAPTVPPLQSVPQSVPKTVSRSGNVPSLRSAPQSVPGGPILPPLRSFPQLESTKTSGNVNAPLLRSAPQPVSVRPIPPPSAIVPQHISGGSVAPSLRITSVPASKGFLPPPLRSVPLPTSSVSIPPLLRSSPLPTSSGSIQPLLGSAPHPASKGVVPQPLRSVPQTAMPFGSGPQPVTIYPIPLPLNSVPHSVPINFSAPPSSTAPQPMAKKTYPILPALRSAPQPVSEIACPTAPTLRSVPHPLPKAISGDLNIIPNAFAGPSSQNATHPDSKDDPTRTFSVPSVADEQNSNCTDQKAEVLRSNSTEK